MGKVVSVAATDLAVLQRVLKRARWDDQGGYPSRCDGKWSFVTGGLPQASPEEWDALFRLAGIVPDEIEALGDCAHCAHAKLVGRRRVERGYERPCVSCKRPQMSNFKPLAKQAKAIN